MRLRGVVSHGDMADLIRAAKRVTRADEAWKRHGMDAARKRRMQAALQALLGAAADAGAKIVWRERPAT